jgi:IclR family pca regulon transcriptional regulator
MGRVLLAALPEADAAAAMGPLVAHTPRTRIDPADLAAELELVRDQGWAMVDGELEEGLRSIAVPLRTRAGVTAALNVSTSTARGAADDVRAEVLPALQEAASVIDDELRAARV